MSMLLSFLVFAILLCLLHVIVQAIPGLCPGSSTTQQSSQFCTTFHQFWHDISLYDREKPMTHDVPVSNDEMDDVPIVDEADSATLHGYSAAELPSLDGYTGLLD